MNRARRLIELTQADAVNDATKELNDLIASGAQVDTQHELRDLVNFIAQKHGINPNLLKTKIHPKGEISNIDTVIKKAWDLMMQRLPAPIAEVVKNLKLVIEDESPEYEGLDGEMQYDDPDGPITGFTIYRNGGEVSKGRISIIVQIMAHEMWHVFEDYTDFYTNLGKVLSGKLDKWKSYKVDDVEELVFFLDLVEYGGVSTDFMRRLKQKIIDRKYWGEEYFLEESEYYKLREIFSKIKDKTFLGAIDDLMAESLGRIVAGKSLFVPRKFIDFILKMG